MKKRLLALLLAAIMCVAILPVPVISADFTVPNTTEYVTVVAAADGSILTVSATGLTPGGTYEFFLDRAGNTPYQRVLTPDADGNIGPTVFTVNLSLGEPAHWMNVMGAGGNQVAHFPIVIPEPQGETFTVTYEAGAGTGGPHVVTYAAGAVHTVLTPAAAGITGPAGQVFAGWLQNPIVQPGAALTVNANITLVAQWQPTGGQQFHPQPTPTPHRGVGAPGSGPFNPRPYRPEAPGWTRPDLPPEGHDPGPGQWQFQVIPASTMFDDVIPGVWYYDYVSLVASHGIFAGTAPRIFDPYVSMTRAMFTRAVGNMEGVNWALTSPASVFTDVALDAWYATAISWASRENLVNGIGGGMFAPSVAITREQMATLLHRYAVARNIPLPATAATTTFRDQGDIGYWAVDSVRAMQAAGLIVGRPNGDFDPQTTATRAEVAALFARFLPHVGL